MTILYDAKSPVRTTLRWHNTILKEVLLSAEFWFFMAVSLTLSVVELVADGEDVIPNFGTSNVAIPANLLVFLLVFFNGSCFNRFLVQYNCARQLCGQLQEAAMMLRVHFLSVDKIRAVAILRYLHAAHHLMYYKMLGIVYWDYLQQEKLLTGEEVEVLKKNAGDTWILVTSWALKLVREGQDYNMIAVQHYTAFEAVAFKFLDTGSMILDTVAMPIPFPYFQFLQFFLYSFCFIIAYSSHEEQFPFSLVTTFFNCLMLLGLRTVGSLFLDPWGTDETDLDVTEFLHSALTNGKAYLLDEKQPDGGYAEDFLSDAMSLAKARQRHSIVLDLAENKYAPEAMVAEAALKARVKKAEGTELGEVLGGTHGKAKRAVHRPVRRGSLRDRAKAGLGAIRRRGSQMVSGGRGAKTVAADAAAALATTSGVGQAGALLGKLSVRSSSPSDGAVGTHTADSGDFITSGGGQGRPGSKGPKGRAPGDPLGRNDGEPIPMMDELLKVLRGHRRMVAEQADEKARKEKQRKAARRPTQIVQDAARDARSWDPTMWATDILDGRDYGTESSSEASGDGDDTKT